MYLKESKALLAMKVKCLILYKITNLASENEIDNIAGSDVSYKRVRNPIGLFSSLSNTELEFEPLTYKNNHIELN